MPTGELHIQLAVNFPNNRKVRSLVRYGRDARAIRDLYVQMLLYCKGSLTDGFVSDDEIGVLVYPDTAEHGKRDAERLAEADLLERGVGGWRVTGWFDRNKSKAAIEEKSAAKARGAKLANHRRWHIEHGYTDPACEWCQSSDQNTDRMTDQNNGHRRDRGTDQSPDRGSESDRIGLVKRSDSTETESESEKEVKALDRPRPAGRVARDAIGSDDDPDFAAFWSAYPRKEAKGQARKAWRQTVITKKTDPKAVILAAERYADDPARRARGRTYTAHPATWLNGERWLEHQDDAPRDDPGADDEDYWR